ncbi:MAG: hypothetical protein HZA77_09600 [Candidatus Schekmanbacteria bacterium]|nr:hypothetical protein [Candidatus Schekmanbacteria bacterium]
MIDKSWEGKVQFYELAFGTWIAYLFLIYMYKKWFKVELDGWRYSLVTLVGASFYIINHYFLKAPFYSILINTYTVAFIVLYYYVLVKPLKTSALKKFWAFMSNFLFTLVYILAENFARFSTEGRLIPGVYVPEFLFPLISFIACAGIILAQRKSN